MEVGDFVKVPSKTMGMTEYAIISEIIHHGGVLYYEVEYFNGDHDVFSPDKVVLVNAEG